MENPYFVGFDLDETLGYFSSPSVHLTYLDPRMYYRDYRHFSPFDPSPQLQEQLDKVFTEFIHCLAGTEDGKQCLRPGILPILKFLLQAKEKGRVQAIAMYSNNGNYGCLRFAKELLEYILGQPVFCALVNFWDPIRAQGNSRNMTRPGRATKTFQVLRKIFSSACGGNEQSILPENTLFFDDNLHPDIFTKISSKNYFKVNPYKKDIPFQTIQTCFIQAIQSQGLDTNREYLEYLKPFIRKSEPTFADLLASIESANRRYSFKNDPFVDDTEEIISRLDPMLFPLPLTTTPLPTAIQSTPLPSGTQPANLNYGQNYFPVVDGGATKRRKRYKRKGNQRKSYRKSQRKAHQKI